MEGHRRAARGSELDSQWTVEQNKQDWSQAKPLLRDLRAAQEKAEAIAHTPDAQPATKILATEAAPLADLMLQKATAIIDEEAKIASTDTRKSLLSASPICAAAWPWRSVRSAAISSPATPSSRATSRGSGRSTSRNSTRCRSGARKWRAEQRKAFDALVEARAKFAPLPQKMFEIRASDRWNMAQWFLTNEAAPRANKLLDIFAGATAAGGSRSGGMVSRQQEG